MRIKRIVFANATEIDGMQLLDNLFDAKTGHNTIPNSMDIKYFGFTLYLRPSEFAKLAAPNDRLRSEFYENLIHNGQPLGYPFLDVKIEKDVDGNDCWQVVGHEGRTRCLAIQKVYGDKVLIPVHVFPLGMRNRNLNPENLSYRFCPEAKPRLCITYEFKRNRYDVESKRHNYGDIAINKNIIIKSHPAEVASPHWQSDMLPKTSPCNLKKVQKNEDDVTEVVQDEPQVMHIYHNQSPAPKGIRLMHRVN